MGHRSGEYSIAGELAQVKARLSTTEAALATTIEQRDQAEHQLSTLLAALATAEDEKSQWRHAAEMDAATGRRLAQKVRDTEAALAESRGEARRFRDALQSLIDRHPDSSPGEHPAADIARAALEQQP